MSGLQFMTYNPVTTQMRENDLVNQRTRAADQSFRRGEFEMDQAVRRADQEQAIDAAIRDGLRPPPTPAAAPPPQGAPVMRGQGAGAIEERPLAPPPGAVAAPAGTPVGTRPAAAPTPATPAAPTPAPQQSPTSLVAQRLANTPGGGRMALDLTNQAAQQREREELRVFQYLSNPSTAHLGMDYAKRIGLEIPPQLAANTTFWQGTSIAKQLYPDDPGAAQKFVTAFVTSGGANVQTSTQAGIAAAGVPARRRTYGVVQGDDGPVFYDTQDPTKTINGPQRTTGQFLTDESGNTNFLRTGRTQVEPITTQDGQPFRGQRFGARTQTSVFEQRRAAYLAANPGDVQGALAFAQGTKQLDAANEMRIAGTLAKQELGNPPDPTVSTQAQRDAYQQRFQARTAEIIQGWRQARPAGQPTPTSPGAPAPAAAPTAPQAEPSPYPEYPNARRAPDGNWYVLGPNGQWLQITEE